MDALTEQQLALKEEFVEARGFWTHLLEDLLRVDPDFFKAYADFSSVPWRNGVLSPKVKELIYIAIDATTTHLYEPGLRYHIRAALDQGATKQEILEVLQLISVLGIHSVTMGLPVLLNELEAREGDQPAADRSTI